MVGISRRGYTLTEAVIASFVLVTALLVVSRLFHASLQYSAWVESKAVATYLAENRMDELRQWARTQTDWSSPPSGPEPEFSKFSMSVTLEPIELASPSTELETGYAPDQRLMPASLRKAVVEVSWDDNSVRLVSLLRAPAIGWRAANSVVVDGTIPGIVNAGTVVELNATGYDSSGRPIDDLFFTWAVEPVFPGAASGTVTPARDGRTAQFRNQLPSASGPSPNSGRCRVVATAVYGGEERRGSSSVLTLAP